MGRFLVISIAVLLSFSIIGIFGCNKESSSGKMIELILDCSGSMNAAMPEGSSRIDSAHEAVLKVLNSLPADTQLAFRVYGNQSSPEKHNCDDTVLLAPFDSLAKNKAAIISQTNQLQARGYTPITKVLKVAAADFPSTAMGERVIILISDGKDTCEGDPCATARSLAEAAVKPVIHTVGFTVDDAARSELQCIAHSTGGTYFDAENANQLTDVISQAIAKKSEKIVVETKGTGKLQIKNADLLGHNIRDADTGKQVGQIFSYVSTVELHAGLYDVSFGDSEWKSVQVTNDKTTVLEPGVLIIPNVVAGVSYQVTDSETGIVQGEISAVRSSLTVMPGVYDVSFGNNFFWFGVNVKAGKQTTLKPGVLKISNPSSFPGHKVFTSSNKEIGELGMFPSSMLLPPGDYFVEMNEQKVPVKIVEGQEVTLEEKTK